MRARARALGSLLRGGEVLLLRGGMGAGKTTFTRALAEGLGVRRPGRVRSPTYTICMRHAGPIELVHLDLFRLAERATKGGAPSPAFSALGEVGQATAVVDVAGLAGEGTLEEDPSSLSGPGRVLVVEWSELWADPPSSHLRLEFRRIEGLDGVRTLAVSGEGSRATALLQAWSELAPKNP